MLPFGIGFGEVLLILVVILLVVGPGKLPEIARTVGQGLRTVRKAGAELRDAIEIEDIKRDVLDGPRRAWEEASRFDVEDVEPNATGTYEPTTAHAPPADGEDGPADDAAAPGPVAQIDPFVAAAQAAAAADEAAMEAELADATDDADPGEPEGTDGGRREA